MRQPADYNHNAHVLAWRLHRARQRMPGKALTDPGFTYTPSTKTAIRRTFARIRREQRKADIEARGHSSQLIPFAPKKAHQ